MKNKSNNNLLVENRTEEQKKDLNRRLKIIIGQINGIGQMIDDDRYCDDVLLQVISAANALKSLGNEILKSHAKSYLKKSIENGNLEVVDEIFNLFGKLK